MGTTLSIFKAGPRVTTKISRDEIKPSEVKADKTENAGKAENEGGDVGGGGNVDDDKREGTGEEGHHEEGYEGDVEDEADEEEVENMVEVIINRP